MITTYPKVCLITCTAGRASCLSRSIRMFLEQDYPNCIQLIYQNSAVAMTLDASIPKDKVILVNNSLDLVTGKRYETLGAIYRDALTFVPEDVEVINHFDDDDFFYSNHVSEGIKGLQAGEKTAYKALYSYYLSQEAPKALKKNVMEPSIFVKKEHIQKWGYGIETAAQHLKWVEPLSLEGEIWEDPNGIPTLLYNWNAVGSTVFKTSGDPNNPLNFNNYHTHSRDFPEGPIKPISPEQLQQYFNLIDHK